MAQINILNGVFVGEYGDPIIFTMVDEDGTAVDISSYTAMTVSVRSPDELKDVDWTGSFITDGSDGQLQITPSNGDIDRVGVWKGQIKLTKSGVVSKSYIFTMDVGEDIA